MYKIDNKDSGLHFNILLYKENKFEIQNDTLNITIKFMKDDFRLTEIKKLYNTNNITNIQHMFDELDYLINYAKTAFKMYWNNIIDDYTIATIIRNMNN